MAQADVQALTSQIDLNEENSILSFGEVPVQKLQVSSDKMIENIDRTKIQDSEKLLGALDRVMAKINLPEIIKEVQKEANTKKSFWDKLTRRANETIDSLLGKYNSIGHDLEVSVMELLKFQTALDSSNKTLKELYENTEEYYFEIERYIAAGHIGTKEITEYIEGLQNTYKETNDALLPPQIQKYEQARDLLDKRIHDLELSQALALNTLPMIVMGVKTNVELSRSIKSSCGITIPAFKQNIILAIQTKQAVMAAHAQQGVVDRTNAQLEIMAQGLKMQTAMATQIVKSQAIDIDKLETLQIAVGDAQDAMRIATVEAREARTQARGKILDMKVNYQKITG